MLSRRRLAKITCMKRLFAALAILAFAVRAELPPLKIPPGGTNVLAPDAITSAKFIGATLGSGKWTDTANGPVPKCWHLDIKQPGVREWSASLQLMIAEPIRSGDTLLLAFYARGTTATGSAEQAGGGIVVEQKVAPSYLKLGVGSFKAGPEWEPVYVPFMAGVESVSNLTALSFQVAGRIQTIDIADVRLLNYGAGISLTNMPRPYLHYPGREANAPWRKAALERIESNRVAGFTIEVTGTNGSPVKGASVHAELKRHDFKFGSAIKSHFLVGPDYRSPGYRKAVEENFDCVVFENELKPDPWAAGVSNSHRVYRHEWVEQSLAWCKERDIAARGHYLMIGVTEPWSEALKDKPDELRARILGHMKSVTGKLGNKISEWDAINHPAGWSIPRKTIDAYFGDSFYADMCKEARKLLTTPLFVNEDQVFRPGRQQEYYFEILTNMIARGAKPDGIGNQAHFHSSFLPAPEDMLRTSDRFAALVPNLAITEFDMLSNGDEELQADWLRDCLIMAYSHPAYSDFILWVFWEGTGYKPECALWHRDWTPKPNGQIWRDWVWGKWKTDVSGETDDAGKFTARGHAGIYELTVEKDGAKKSIRQHITKDHPAIRIIAP